MDIDRLAKLLAIVVYPIRFDSNEPHKCMRLGRQAPVIMVLAAKFCKWPHLPLMTSGGDSEPAANVVSLPAVFWPKHLEHTVDRSELEKLALLARLNVDDSVFEEVSQGISDVLALVEQLQAVDTGGVEPMSHPLDTVQRLRPDEVSEANRRDAFQAIAPQTEDGLYLVPKVIE